jgi:hypothetical protein
MKIRCIEIQNFRGISALRWSPSPDVNCLIGPGDVGKTTILDAIELALAPRYQAIFDDCDFYGTNHEYPIQITITLGALGEAFKALTKYGEFLRGWDAGNQVIVDEPQEADGLEDVLSVRLTVDHTLEPHWRIYTDRFVGGSRAAQTLSFEDRQTIAPTRVGVYTDRHLAWGRQSILMRLSGKDRVAGNLLADVSRVARKQFAESGEQLFRELIAKIGGFARLVGVKLGENMSAKLDVQSISVTAGGISLHEGDLPLRLLGSGSARLLVAALQHNVAEEAPFALIDEVEHGLEPHRITCLLRYLTSSHAGVRPQLFLTTHSPIVLQELAVNDLQVVRRVLATGKVDVIPAKPDISDIDAQSPLRSIPNAYLARSILVCEGKTEVGLARGLDRYWASGKFHPFAAAGVVPTDGRGKDRAPSLAKHFHKLQYRVALLLDSDKEPDDKAILPELVSLGIEVIRWENGKASEDVLFLDLPDHAIKNLVDLMMGQREFATIPDQINSHVKSNLVPDWAYLKNHCSDATIRTCLAVCAKKHDWIKNRLDVSETIGLEILGPNLDSLKGQNAACITALRTWVDGE